jgi:cold shock CspA family protein
MTSKRIARITQYFPERGFGWAMEELADGKKQTHFLHITSCSFVPEVGQFITFNIGVGRKGPMAVDVELFQAEKVSQ